MDALAGLAAVLVCGGCALSASATDRRLAVLGVAVALLVAPLVASPWPSVLPLAFREVAVITGCYLLWLAARGNEAVGMPHDGRTFLAVFVIVAFVAGAALAPALGPDRGPAGAIASASAAAIAALALGIAAPHRLAGGLSAILLVLSASLAVVGLTGPPGPLDHAVVGAALLAVTAAAALVATAGPAGTPAAPPLRLEEPTPSPTRDAQPTLFDSHAP